MPNNIASLVSLLNLSLPKATQKVFSKQQIKSATVSDSFCTVHLKGCPAISWFLLFAVLCHSTMKCNRFYSESKFVKQDVNCWNDLVMCFYRLP